MSFTTSTAVAIELGLGAKSSYGDLLFDDRVDKFPEIQEIESKWRVILIDLDFNAIRMNMDIFAGRGDVSFVLTAIGTPGFGITSSRSYRSQDDESHLRIDHRFNDKERTNFLMNYYVPVLSLDQIVNEFHLKRIDLLKIDIQGSEVPALANYSWLLNPKMIDLEIHHPDSDASLTKLLNERGYKCIDVKSSGTRRCRKIFSK